MFWILLSQFQAYYEIHFLNCFMPLLVLSNVDPDLRPPPLDWAFNLRSGRINRYAMGKRFFFLNETQTKGGPRENIGDCLLP